MTVPVPYTDGILRIDNALPGRDGGEIEIFGMEGIPKYEPYFIHYLKAVSNRIMYLRNDLDAWRRKKETEAGVAAGSTSQPPAKRPKLDKRPISEAELAVKLAAHRALMSGNDLRPPIAGLSGATASGAPTVFGAPQVYAPPAPGMGGPPPPGMGGPPPFPGAPPFFGAPPPGGLPPGYATILSC